MVFVDKRHWPEFGIATMFFLMIEALACIGIITMFLCRRLPFCHVRTEISSQHVTVFSGGPYFQLFLLFSRYRCFSQTTVGGAYRPM